MNHRGGNGLNTNPRRQSVSARHATGRRYNALLSRMESPVHRKGARRVRASGWGISTGGKPSASASSNWHVLLAQTEQEARQALKVAGQALKRLRLELHPDKTRVIRAAPRHRFLGLRLPDSKERFQP